MEMIDMADGRVGFSGPEWRTARACDGGACVQVAASGAAILVADSKTPGGPVLSYTKTEFREFILSAKNGDFDELIAE
jgi:Domain of unknown function (DUF397)